MMFAYSLLLLLALTLSAPWWLTRMATTQRYREGLAQRLGRVSAPLREFARGHRIVWIHAVSVGEVLAATRLVAELEAALTSQRDAGFRIVISTTTRTGQALARQRFGAERVFYYPLDLARPVRAYLNALHPELLILMESELWPRMLAECNRRGVPVSVVNARVSDRSFARAKRFRAIWAMLLRKITLFLAQSEEDAQRLISLGANAESVKSSGNLKYDVRAPRETLMVQRVQSLIGEAPLVVCGSTLEGEEQALLDGWKIALAIAPSSRLLIAPRHPERFNEVGAAILASGYGLWRAIEPDCSVPGSRYADTVLLLDTIGDLAGTYELASVAFVGGSLVPRGGHNPLEPAQFGVPVIMGPSFENFRDIVAKMQAAGGILIVPDAASLSAMLTELLTNAGEAKTIGERGREVFVSETGATARTVDALLQLIPLANPGGPR